MSKRLTDDALAYFDECVSLSTFDGSDFSSLEETPPIHQVSSTTQVEDGTTPQVSSKCFHSFTRAFVSLRISSLSNHLS